MDLILHKAPGDGDLLFRRRIGQELAAHREVRAEAVGRGEIAQGEFFTQVGKFSERREQVQEQM